MSFHKVVRKSVISLVLCLLLTPFARYISPETVLGGSKIYLAYLPFSVMISLLFIFGRAAILPLLIGSTITFSYILDLNPVQLIVFVCCLLLPLFLSCGIARYYLGSRWRFSITNKGMGVRIFWLGFFCPFIIKLTMYVVGSFINYPPALSPFFGESSKIYSVIDLQNLIAASLIFTMLIYYPLRMALNPHYALAFWRRCIKPYLTPARRVSSVCWGGTWAAFLLLLCSSYKSTLIAGYLVPLIFVLFTLGIRHMGPRIIALLWGISAWLLLTYNKGFLQGVNTEFSLAFTLSVIISFTVCILYMTMIFHKNEWMKRVYHLQAMTDPLTQLPNLRALEEHFKCFPTGVLCCLRMSNLEFLSRHYGLMMRIHCKREITQLLKPWLNEGEQIFQLPGCELLIFLQGAESQARLNHMVDLLNNKKIHWHNSMLEIEYGASYCLSDGDFNELHRTLGQLSYLAEQACSENKVLSLNTQVEAVSDETTERVLLLHKVKHALNADDEQSLQLYAQPIVDQHGHGYKEILTRMFFKDEMITPDKFIPIIAEFNLSVRFDMLVMSKLITHLREQVGGTSQAQFSVNLMPFTLMQKDIAQQIVSLFATNGVPTSAVIIEVTEEQAFSNSETSIQNITLLRENGFKIAIDDFGTGYANYERLKKLQADIIKIDGCFIKDIASDSLDIMIVKSISDLAHAKGLSVVAEFVETNEQRTILLDLGVQYLQGYLLGKPEPLVGLHSRT
ncbi:sensor domain-containing phosphodiesterase [Enterobacteriaceae bacterium H11S18]|uniref:sensor domain-containing phosphodiesterase n=1 Tax=Dryocola clanedunensis TaxID=2925396 RepID=UPI0022F137AA|nr:EAL domain-containing protein [Dryocola clanedunensis]MCT4707096.1 sensor domain-containing phosphodiesterase [Dryocola clanedunensis]MCT4712607.1 sensor domain-containing phosphodiesterase [Dryocola clanedunensis]